MARHAVIASLPFVGTLDRTSRDLGRQLAEALRVAIRQGDLGGGDALPSTRAFSKVLFPSLRLGYAIVPGDLVKAFVGARILLDRHPPTADQHVLAAFIGEGHLERHIRRLRGIYADQRHHVVEVFDRVLPAALGHVQPCDQGMHMVVWLRDDIDDKVVTAAAMARGVGVRAVSPMYAPGTERPGLLLGFGGYRTDDIESAARRLAAVIKMAAAGSRAASVQARRRP